MPQPYDNIQIWNAKTIDELARIASLEQGGDNVLWIRKFGRTDVLSAGVKEDVWEQGGTRSLPYTAGEKYNIVSTDTADTSDGTGARFLLINGLDVDYNLQSEVVVMNGTTNVQTVN